MSITINAKGTSVPFFTIGRGGTTIFQGVVNPDFFYSPKNGDIWINTSKNTVEYWSTIALSWVSTSVPTSYSYEGSDNVTTSITDGVTIIPGMTLTPSVGSYSATFNCNCTSTPTSVTSTATSDLTTLYTTLMALTATNTTHASAFGNETLGPGVYTIPAAGSVAGTLTLDASNNPTSLFVFKVGAAFTTSAGAQIVLINLASSANVFFVCEGAASTGASTIFKGTILANQAAVSTGAGTVLDGRLLSRLGAVSIAGSTLTLPTDTSVISVGQVATFSMFTAGGDVSNAGVSDIIGNVGTNLGAVTGFGSATISGAIYTPATMSAAADFSLYKNGVLVSVSSRSRSTTSTVDTPMTLQTTVSAILSDVFDIRSSVTLGTMTVGNRIFTLAAIAVTT